MAAEAFMTDKARWFEVTPYARKRVTGLQIMRTEERPRFKQGLAQHDKPFL